VDNVLNGAPLFAPLLLPNLALLAWIGIYAFSHSGSILENAPIEAD
jgi:hypothetical protein